MHERRQHPADRHRSSLRQLAHPALGQNQRLRDLPNFPASQPTQAHKQAKTTSIRRQYSEHGCRHPQQVRQRPPRKVRCYHGKLRSLDFLVHPPGIDPPLQDRSIKKKSAPKPKEIAMTRPGARQHAYPLAFCWRSMRPAHRQRNIRLPNFKRANGSPIHPLLSRPNRSAKANLPRFGPTHHRLMASFNQQSKFHAPAKRRKAHTIPIGQSTPPIQELISKRWASKNTGRTKHFDRKTPHHIAPPEAPLQRSGQPKLRLLRSVSAK